MVKKLHRFGLCRGISITYLSNFETHTAKFKICCKRDLAQQYDLEKHRKSTTFDKSWHFNSYTIRFVAEFWFGNIFKLLLLFAPLGVKRSIVSRTVLRRRPAQSDEEHAGYRAFDPWPDLSWRHIFDVIPFSQWTTALTLEMHPIGLLLHLIWLNNWISSECQPDEYW